MCISCTAGSVVDALGPGGRSGAAQEVQLAGTRPDSVGGSFFFAYLGCLAIFFRHAQDESDWLSACA
jgi:hypothetical protein